MPHHRSAAVPLLLAALVLAVSGCDGSPKSTPPSAPPAPAASSAPVPAVVVTETIDAGAGAQFRTPSGNIGCAVFSDGVRCDIITKAWTAPPRPADCDLDWGSGLSLDERTGVRFNCSGDSVIPQAEKVLAYGHAIRAANTVCTSTEPNLRCENTTTKHGFTLAKENYTIF